MAYRNKIYVAFDADTDMTYYRTLKMWKGNKFIDFDFFDAHDLNNLMPYSLEATIKARLRERLKNTKKFILLLGENTKKLYRYVRWEVEIAISLNIPIIVCNLNGKTQKDINRCLAVLNGITAIHIPFKKDILKYALDNYNRLPSFDGNDYHYPASTFKEQGWD